LEEKKKQGWPEGPGW